MPSITRFLREDDAATAVEYAVMLSMILLGAIAAIGTLGTSLRDNIFDSSSKLGTALSTSS